ncbi:hypothetical protein Caci_6131 [Catenulispora acidiphila DSM 44928]|uniref:Uncharacterized protein n=1 Tax=Catenulispora acidiphila (strain DSM 44928 / JCM 14897 / NBRC 102108 / NRRL B-24433 / ID139908) TaxID=479433 RepID=C7QIA8_CATAD|nr:hypothetical protein [Catenulispora acidiphila]ACU74985.1 hypothetical protein Caci_6131 [Catenulispora acidiphila DSM 44928]
MVTENGRAELREFYTDPALPLTIAVGQAFDLVSMPAAVGHAALAALRARRVRLGPVVADSRKSVMRVGFLVAPAHAPDSPHSTRSLRAEVGTSPETVLYAQNGAGHAETAALRDWVGRLGGALGVRVGGRGSTATLPPLLPWRGWLHWLVPPGTPAVLWTPAGALLTVLSERTGARAL